MRLLYSQLMRLLVPVMILRLLWRSRRHSGYRQRLLQRLGFGLPTLPAGVAPVWIHAVSVGETLAIAPLITALLDRFPNRVVVVTSTTPTGFDQVRLIFGDRFVQCWLPFDTPGAVSRAIAHFQPHMIALVETEIWPNLIAAATQQGIPVCLLNARLSARSARGYARVAPLARPAIGALSVIAAQHRADARRLSVLGAQDQALRVVGNLKFDIDSAAIEKQCRQIADQLGPHLRQRQVWVAASTHPGEEVMVIAAFQRWLSVAPDGLLILAPRHPERVSGLRADGLWQGFAYQYRSEGDALRSDTQILIWDTLGELGAAMGLAEVVFVGGSLVPHGGHNPLEAAVWSIPVLTGPYTFNFAATFRDLIAAGGAIKVADVDSLSRELCDLSLSPERVAECGASGRRMVDAHRGALDRQIDLISGYFC